MKKDKMFLIVWACIGLTSSVVFAAAIPTAAECKAARAKLAELTSDDYKALKAKTKTNEQVGDALVQYADNEESSAGKFALLQDAFLQYVLGKNVDKAESVYSKAQTIGGVEYALEMAHPSRYKLSAYATSKNAPAKALKERIAEDEKSFQRVGIVKAKLKKAPGDESLCEQLGIEYAAIGDWESALAAFVTAAGEVAKVADWELNGGKGIDYTAATVGAFWWKFADNFPKRKNVEESMKLHAAIWYKLALDKDAFKGNEKTIIEKRIAETEKFGAAEKTAKELAAKKMATLDPIKLEFSKDCAVKLIGCPAGEFVMGNDGCGYNGNPAWKRHDVTITRPFWMASKKVTHRIWSIYQQQTTGKGYVFGKYDDKLGGWERVHSTQPENVNDFFEWLNKQSRFSHLKPEGYIFRLATEAEWEYALIADVKDPNDLYYRAMHDQLPSYAPIAVQWDEEKVKLPSDVRPNGTFGTKVGTKLPNRWGFYDMIDNVPEMVLDTIDSNRIYGEYSSLKMQKQDAVVYAAHEKDPLRFFAGPTRGYMKRGGVWSWSARFYDKGVMQPRIHTTAIRIVLGPDLMKEKGYTAKATKK